MAASRPVARTPVRPKGGGLNRPSVGGLPLWAVVVGGALLAFGAYRFYKNYQANQSSAAGTPSSTATPSDSSGGASSSPTDLTPIEDLAGAINGLTGVLGGGGAGISTANPPTTSDASTAPPPPVGATTSTTTTNNYYTNPAPAAPASSKAPTAPPPPQANSGAFAIGSGIASGLADFGSATGAGPFTTPGATSTLAAGVTSPGANPADISNVNNPLYSGIFATANIPPPSQHATDIIPPHDVLVKPGETNQQQRQKTGAH